MEESLAKNYRERYQDCIRSSCREELRRYTVDCARRLATGSSSEKILHVCTAVKIFPVIKLTLNFKNFPVFNFRIQ